MHKPAADDRHHRSDVLDLIGRHGQVIAIEYSQAPDDAALLDLVQTALIVPII